MQIMQRIAKAVLPVALLIPCIASADVFRPYLEIVNLNGDTGAVLTDFGGGNFEFDIDATATAILTTADLFDITDQAFSLHATFDNPTDGTFSGTFSVAGDLLAGTFSNLSVAIFSSGTIDFAADLLYTSGSLMGDLSGGRIEGLQSGITGQLQTKLGSVTVVPVPAAVWLFGSGLLGLAGIARRKTS